MAQGDEGVDRLERDPQPGGVAERAVGVGEPVEEVGVLALRSGGDDLARPGEDVHLQHRLVGQTAAERRRLDAEPGDGAAQGDGLELGHHERREAVRQGRLDEVLVGAHALHVSGAGLRVDRDHLVEQGDVEPGRVGARAGPEEVGGLLGQPHRGIERDGRVAGSKTTHGGVVARTSVRGSLHDPPSPSGDEVRHTLTLCRRADTRHAGCQHLVSGRLSPHRQRRPERLSSPRRRRARCPGDARRHTPPGSCGRCR